MNWHDKAFLALYFLAIIIIQCIWQRRLIKAHKPINHVLHGAYYVIAILPAVFFFALFWWQVIVIAVATRLAFFDFILNAVRGKRLFYNSDAKAGSLIDRIENRFTIFWVNALKVLYVVAFIIVIIKLK